MTIRNAKTLNNFKCPIFFDGKLSVSYDSKTIPEEISCFNSALALINAYIQIFPPNIPLLSLNVYFLSNGSAEFVFNDDRVLGCYNQFIFFPIRNWRQLGLTNGEIIFTMIEELCHAIWRIPDGADIQQKVEEVFQASNFEISYNDFLEGAFKLRPH